MDTYLVEGNIEKLLTGREVATFLNIHLNTVRRWANSGELTCIRIGKRGDRRFRMRDVEAFLGKAE